MTVIERECARMVELRDAGLPECYPSLSAYMIEYFLDFSWDGQKAAVELAGLLKSNEWGDLAEQVRALRGWDFRREVAEAIPAYLDIDPDAALH